MKNPRDPRHLKRITLMQKLFSYSFDNAASDKAVTAIVSNLTPLDEKIQAAAPEWPLAKISKVDLAILRLATYEMTINREQPVKVVIDEAIELAKEYGNPSSPQFINGVLGTIYKNLTQNVQ